MRKVKLTRTKKTLTEKEMLHTTAWVLDSNLISMQQNGFHDHNDLLVTVIEELIKRRDEKE